jgi:hypothetical protein
VIIESLPETAVRDHVVLSAKVRWEDGDGKDRIVYAVVPAALADCADRGAWLSLTALFIAARRKERRLRLDVPVDPVLRRGLTYALRQFELWYGLSPVVLEAPQVDAVSPARPGGRRAALFVSGGVDSWSSFLRNRAEVPAGHPYRFAAGLHVDWMGPSAREDLEEYLGRTAERWSRSRAGQRLAECGLEPVPVVTNARRLAGNDFRWDWMFTDHGAMFCALAHLVAGGHWSASLAATYDLDGLGPWGSHPLLDPWYASTGLRIFHDSPDLSRMRKLAGLVRHPDVVASLDVCAFWFQRGEDVPANCGACEKCLRTLLGLEALGVPTDELDNFEAPLSPASMAAITSFQDRYEQACWRDVLAGLQDRGHPLQPAVAALVRAADVRNPVIGARG